MADASKLTPFAAQPLQLWRFRDGKPGHEQQSRGLIQALERLTSLQITDIDVRELRVGLLAWLAGRFPAGSLPAPRLLVGAGSATHLPMLAARRTVGGQALVLMRPGLPRRLFDFLMVPAHDNVAPAQNLLVTRGVLNPMRPGTKVTGSVLVLFGGESRHAHWDNKTVLQQLDALAMAWPALRVADSRRTPPELSSMLAARYADRFQGWQNCPPGWLASQLAEMETVWVSEDSVSMLYEALTAGCRVGVLELLPAVNRSRVMRGLDQLVAEGMVSRFREWQSRPAPLSAPPQALAEADRAARWLLERLGLGVAE